jgi:DNA repair photolyase
MSAVEYREEPCKGALNKVKGMAFGWSLNPYMGCAHRCTYCYVRAYEKRADRPFDERYGRSLRVKTNVAEVLRYEVHRRSWKRDNVVVGAATDPYQPVEGKYRLTRACIEVFSSVHNPFGMITRGPMVVRDIDVLQEASSRASVAINMSIPTLDLDVWSKTEPGTAPPRQRLRAVRMLADSGIKVSVAMAPILPGISDRPEQLEEVIKGARDAGATGIWANVLFLRSGTREHFFSQLARDWPDLLERYRELYRPSAYLDDAAKEPVLSKVRELRELYSVADRRIQPIRPPAQEEQLSLFALGLAG